MDRPDTHWSSKIDGRSTKLAKCLAGAVQRPNPNSNPAYVVLVPFCLLGRGNVYTVQFRSKVIAFVWLCVSWFYSKGIWIGRVICLVKGNSPCICGRSDRSVVGKQILKNRW